MSRSLNNRLVIEFATVRGPRSFVRLMRSYGARRLLGRIVPRKRIVYWTGSAAFCRAVYGCTCLVSIRSSSGSGQVVCIYRRFSSSLGVAFLIGQNRHLDSSYSLSYLVVTPLGRVEQPLRINYALESAPSCLLVDRDCQLKLINDSRLDIPTGDCLGSLGS